MLKKKELDIWDQEGLILIRSATYDHLNGRPSFRDVEMSDFIIDDKGRCLKNRFGCNYDFAADHYMDLCIKKMAVIIGVLVSFNVAQFLLRF